MSPADHADPPALARRIAALASAADGRVIVALAGPPASGKSTLAADLVARLPNSALVAMDGFHLDNRLLEPRGLLPRKGAPETFDLGGLTRTLTAIRAGGEVVVPVFDRAREIAVAGAATVPASARIVVVEGNWLLLNAPGWRDLGPWDLTIRLEAGEEALRTRLLARWAGLPPEEALAKIEGNDLPNARRFAAESRVADLIVI